MWIFSGLSSPLISVIVFMSISNSFIALACNIAWSQEVWCLLLCYSFSRLLWIFRTIFSFIKILRFFFLFLWKVPLAFWYRLHWNYGLPRWFSDKKSACNSGDVGSIPGSARSPGAGNDNLLHYSCLENSMDRGAWQATIHEVAKIWTPLNMPTYIEPIDCFG